MVGKQGDRFATTLPVAKIAMLSCVAGLLAVSLSRLPFDQGVATLVYGQTLWNAAQVGIILSLAANCALERDPLAIGLATACAVLLPFSIYAIGPGALAFAVLMLATAAGTLTRSSRVAVVFEELGPAPFYAKFEFLAFVCTLLCSLYNYNASKACFPYWSAIFTKAAKATGFDTPASVLAKTFYTMGLEGVSMPSLIAAGREGSNLGALLFLLIWTVLPALYVLYFGLLAKAARGLPGAPLQRLLCAYCIFHFLFLTDLVAYQFGRGLANPQAEWAHWSERWVWRIAIFLPVYQKLVSYSLRDNGTLGARLHYALMAWAVWFVVYQVMAYDLVRFVAFVGGDHDPAWHKIFGVGYRQELGYHGSLVLLTLFYAYSAIALRSRRLSARGIALTG